ncbi:hypothetical protein I302_103846 [Kwoniella bestiolae CBS 10118]|uniref:Uncharacterized protein n=1 Tax=Kwoniella bestiolae CBS 10118 TaxID=1296100 RepID=A0A1B9G9J0_9TREE|nr:hypothetical protein I302_02549 [Kwoniella bestiolae CBS 10118]OCF27704.1 hypothetical protein I302_02549 [Kwoniella bestiolae CBS 10118]
MPPSNHSRDSAGTASNKSSWRSPEFLKQIRSGGSKGKLDERYSSSEASSSPKRESPVRGESITITRTTNYGNHQDRSNGHRGDYGESRPPVSRRVSSSKSDYPAPHPYGGQPLSRQVSNSVSNSTAHLYSGGGGGQPLSRQVSYSAYSLTHHADPNVPNGMPNGTSNGISNRRPSVSRQNSDTKYSNANFEVDETPAGHTIHVYKTWSRQSSVDRHSQPQPRPHRRSMSTARDDPDDSPPSRHVRGRASSRTSRHAPPEYNESDRDRGIHRGDGTPRRRGSSRRPDYKLSSDVYDPAGDTRPSMDQRRFSSYLHPHIPQQSNNFPPSHTQRFSMENFNPHTMDIIRFRRHGGGTKTNIRECFYVRPKCTYGSATDMLRTSPYHYPITTPEGRVVWRSRCPHTDASHPSERCKILHTNIDPSTISTTQIRDDDHTNYAISLLSPNHPGVQGAELNSDFTSLTLEDKVREMEMVQQDMANRFIEWSHTPKGRQRLNLESVFLDSCERLTRRKARLEKYRVSGFGSVTNGVNREGHVNGMDDSVRKGFKALSNSLEGISHRLQVVKNDNFILHYQAQRSDTVTHAEEMAELTKELEEKMKPIFSSMQTLALQHMSELTGQKSFGSWSIPPSATNINSTRQVRDSPALTNGTSPSKVQFRILDEPHRTDTLGQSILSTISTTTAPGQGQVSMGKVASPFERASKFATKTYESLQSFDKYLTPLKSTVSELVTLSTKRYTATEMERERERELHAIYEEMVRIQIGVDALKESVQKSRMTWMDEEEEQIRSEEDGLRMFRDSLLS